MKEEWIEISYEYEKGVGGAKLETNKDGEFYFGIGPKDDVDVKIIASDNDEYNDQVFKNINFEYK